MRGHRARRWHAQVSVRDAPSSCGEIRVRTASPPCALTSPTSTVSDRSPAFSVAVRVISEVPSGARIVTSTVPPPSQAPCRAVTASSSACAHAWTRIPVPAAPSIVAYPTAVRRGTPGRAISSDVSASCSWDAGAFGDAVEVNRPRSTSSARCRAVSASRPDVHSGPLHADADAAGRAVQLRVARRVAEQVVRGQVVHRALQAAIEIAGVQNCEPVGLAGERPQLLGRVRSCASAGRLKPRRHWWSPRGCASRADRS